MSTARHADLADVMERDRRIEQLLADVQASSGPAAWPRMEKLIAELVGLYGRAIGRILEHATAASPSTRGELDARLASDALASSILLLHDLHPLPVETRIARGLALLRAELPDAGAVVLDSVTDGVALLHIEGSGRPPSNAVIARAIELEAPELEGIRVEGAPEPRAPQRERGAKLVPVERLRRRGAP